jgi:hypothetical protein
MLTDDVLKDNKFIFKNCDKLGPVWYVVMQVEEVNIIISANFLVFKTHLKVPYNLF